MELYLTLILVSLGLVLVPGPNVALIIANAMRYGTRYGLCTVAGTTCGIALQLALVVVGIGALLDFAANVLIWVKWAGVLYMVYLGFRTWLTSPEDLSLITARKAPALTLYWQGLGIAVLNPKTLIFNAAFLPQFVAPGGSYAWQLAVVSAIFLTTVTIGDSIWAVFAGALRPVMLKFQRLRNRVTGLFFVAAGIGLALSDQRK
ncbi:LysE family translocator [Sneathiella marina]|uniref:LysE family translocator n=1 Tax=Sneathiella marina TaxID=2950108 RepID=A0ABY4W5K0_9PROT|nr:LysE family translocator [Sneathiella marina]USG59921.1 LysE family translocator [Sneathiella marina]